MPREDAYASLREAISSRLEAIVDPCSAASGAPAGLISMGLVGDVKIEEREQGAHVDVTLYLTEPGCIVGAIFQVTAQRELAALPGIESADVQIDHAYLWDPTQMTPAYQARLAEFRACQAAHMTSLHQSLQHSKGRRLR